MVLRERSKLLRKAVYAIDKNMKDRMPEKNASGELEKELAYCKELEKCIESDPNIKLNSCIQREVEPAKGRLWKIPRKTIPFPKITHIAA